MSAEILLTQVDPVFDPNDVGASSDGIKARLPLHAPTLRGNVVGDIASKLRGEGYETDDVRPYEFGDDPRHVDHNVTARQPDGWPQVRMHYADITPTMYVVTDVTQSRYSINPGYYSEQRLGLAAAMAFMRIAQVESMPVTTVISNDTAIRGQRKPEQGRAQMLRTGHFLAEHMDEGRYADNPEWQNRPRLAGLLQHAAKLCTTDVVVVISDFRDAADPSDSETWWKPGLEKLNKHGNNLIAVELTNPEDYELPKYDDRLTTNHGIEWIGNDRKGRRRRAQYQADAQELQATIDDAMVQAGARHIKLTTSDPEWIYALRQQIKR